MYGRRSLDLLKCSVPALNLKNPLEGRFDRKRPAVLLREDAALAHEVSAVREIDDFLELRRNQQHSCAQGRHLQDEFVNALARADIDASARLVEDQELRAGYGQFRQQHLLLVSARIEGDFAAYAIRYDAEVADRFVYALALVAGFTPRIAR